MNLAVPESLYLDPTSSDYKLIIYILLQIESKCISDPKITHIESLLIQTFNKEVDRRLKTKYIEATNNLIESGILRGEEIKSGIYLIEKESFNISGEYFALLPHELALRVIKLNKIQLIRFVCLIAGGLIDGENKLSVQYFANKMTCSRNTISNYISELESEKIIEVGRGTNNSYRLLDN